jgi:pimeloyl-ACP methyl ester carboxylesterase
LLKLSPGERPSYPEQLPLLAGLLPQIFTPVQIIAGGRDPIVPVTNADFLDAPLITATRPP